MTQQLTQHLIRHLLLQQRQYQSQNKSQAFGQLPFSQGYSLVELMIGLSLGMVLTMGVSVMYTQSTNNYQRMSDEVLRISNTQYVGNTLRREIQAAGFWGAFIPVGEATVIFDPCATDLPTLELAVNQPVFGYNAPAMSPIGCLDSENFIPGTDILVLRRASGVALTDADQMVDGEVYIQTNPEQILVEIGNSGSFVASALNADNTVAEVGTTPGGGAATIMIKRNRADADPADFDFSSRLAGDVRKYRTDIYFVSPCTIPADGGDVCTGEDDDGGQPVPSLKKLELSAQSGNLQFDIVTVAEGVSNMQILYGIDTSDAETLGSGSPDSYIANPTILQFNDVVNLQMSLLIRDKQTGEFTDKNIYTLAGQVVGPFNDSYSRQVLNSNYRIANLSMRRAGSN